MTSLVYCRYIISKYQQRRVLQFKSDDSKNKDIELVLIWNSIWLDWLYSVQLLQGAAECVWLHTNRLSVNIWRKISVISDTCFDLVKLVWPLTWFLLGDVKQCIQMTAGPFSTVIKSQWLFSGNSIFRQCGKLFHIVCFCFLDVCMYIVYIYCIQYKGRKKTFIIKYVSLFSHFNVNCHPV